MEPTKVIYNLEALESVEVFDKEVCDVIQWFPYKKSFWGGTELEGFYSIAYSFDDRNKEPYTKADLEASKFHDISLLIEDKVAYFKPYVKLTFVSGQSKIIKFNDYSDAIIYGNEKAASGISVPLTIVNRKSYEQK